MRIPYISGVNNFSTKIKQGLQDRKLSQGQLSIKTGIKRATIANYIAGRSNPSYEKFLLICIALKIKEL